MTPTPSIEARPRLLSVTYSPPADAGGFPFSVPSLAGLADLPVDLDHDVVVLVGENGTGKSTLLEGLAIAAGLPAVGSARPASDPTLEPQRRLARCLRLTWRMRSRRGFFLRAEDFFGFQKEVARARAEHLAEIARLDREMADASAWSRGLAQGPHRASVADMQVRYGENPDAASHGEAFLRLFGSRLAPEGLYLLDEPEAALSPQSQLAFLAMMKEAVDGGAQFVLATHSPILMAIPGARILTFDAVPPSSTTYDDLEAVRLVRDFLEAPQRFMRHVWGEPNG